MIDLHSHILPRVDDGAVSLKDSIEMAKAAVEDGITEIVATPHHKTTRFDNYKSEILPKVNKLNEALAEQGIPLTVLPGQETRVYGDFVDDLQNGEILTINEHTNYVLVEFPHAQVPWFAKQLLYNLQMGGYRPIIVHPERNEQLIEEPDLLYEFVSNGAFTQLTAGSICGHFGKEYKKFSYELMNANLAHLISCDAHNTSHRGFCLTEAYTAVRAEYGLERVFFFAENAEAVVEGNMVDTFEPEQVKRSKLLGLFSK
ncbi:tyrosine-protein phosphatase [Halobacillus mangrovi]|uniref:Tyrosine-protein phosphatase n=1 Tax=Halobacillus mangrovi TaxID=402384 RepID=A0A1W5ZSL3_9BACI|nr:CpsB/CapC family capsule biosynthesis tyrosine phosphatase [Halobacillus mangrovi]ARI76282.1 tyrosine protein phosphatase [Halobacillus mangrovi]